VPNFMRINHFSRSYGGGHNSPSPIRGEPPKGPSLIELRLLREYNFVDRENGFTPELNSRTSIHMIYNFY